MDQSVWNSKFNQAVSPIDETYRTDSGRMYLTVIVCIAISMLNGVHLLAQTPTESFWTLQFVLWTQLALWFFLFKGQQSWHLIAVYVLSRAVLFYTNPILEDDYFRYLWDAQVFDTGLNPYLFPPESAALDFLNSEWRSTINYPHVPTIYPPVAQFYFWFVWKIFGESLIGLRVGAMALELLLALVCQHLAKPSKRPIAALVLFSPILMKENFNSVHFDLLAVLLTSVSLLLLMKNKNDWGSAIAIGLASSVKIYPLLLLPLLAQRSSNNLRFVLVGSGIFVASYLPFVQDGRAIFSGTSTFLKDWVFYPYLPGMVFSLFQFFGLGSDYSFAKMIGLVVFALFYLWLLMEAKKLNPIDSMNLFFLALFFCTSVMNTWYWLWAIPTLIIRGPYWIWIIASSTSFGYAWFVDPDLYRILHLPWIGLLLIASMATVYNISTNRQKAF